LWTTAPRSPSQHGVARKTIRLCERAQLRNVSRIASHRYHVSDQQKANLGLKTFLNGTLVSNIVLHTSSVATGHFDGQSDKLREQFADGTRQGAHAIIGMSGTRGCPCRKSKTDQFWQ
jgi:hypothetical protein